MDKIKTLSQALRLGATLKPQIFNSLCALNEKGQVSTCAFGAAFDGLKVAKGEEPIVLEELSGIRVVEAFRNVGIELGVQRTHPIMGNSTTVDCIVVSLNDTHHWIREHIAD